MIFQFSFNISEILTPIVSIIVLFVLMILMVYLYVKHRIFLPILTVFLFSMVMGTMFLEIVNFPFTPYLQYLFIVFQTLFLILTTIQLIVQSVKNNEK